MVMPPFDSVRVRQIEFLSKTAEQFQRFFIEVGENHIAVTSGDSDNII
jgi:hypothetical protein